MVSTGSFNELGSKFQNVLAWVPGMRVCFFNTGNLTKYENPEKGSYFIERNKDGMVVMRVVLPSCNKNLIKN